MRHTQSKTVGGIFEIYPWVDDEFSPVWDSSDL
jgi:hypothetical protein